MSMALARTRGMAAPDGNGDSYPGSAVRQRAPRRAPGFLAAAAAGARQHCLAKAERMSSDDSEDRNARLRCLGINRSAGDKGSRLKPAICTLVFCFVYYP